MLLRNHHNFIATLTTVTERGWVGKGASLGNICAKSSSFMPITSPNNPTTSTGVIAGSYLDSRLDQRQD
jgi:hypothetical protein